MKTSLRLFTDAATFALFAALLVVAIRAPAASTDVEVYWNAAKHFWNGEKVYAFARDGLRCFKYPPWVLPMFLPMGILQLGTAAVVFRIFQIGAIAWLREEIRKNLSNSPEVGLAFLLFWGFWMYNTQTGQVTAFLIAGALAGFSWIESGRARRGGLALLTSLSTKAVQLYVLLGTPVSQLKGKLRRAILMTLSAWALLCLPSLWPYRNEGLSQWWRDIHTAGLSVGPDLSASNQGIAGVWIAALGLPANDLRSHFIGSALSALVLGAIFLVYKKRLDSRSRFFVMLAYGGILHPLAFSYNYLWVFPLAAVAVDRFWRQQSCPPVLIACRIATALTLLELTVISQRTVGDIPWLIFPAHRAVATVLLSWILIAAGSPSTPRNRSAC